MSTLPKHWVIASSAPPDFIDICERRYSLHAIVAQTLFNRGFTDPDEAHRFLNPDAMNTNPFLMKGVNTAVARIRRAIKNGELIIVYGDFDADGVTSTTLLVQTLTALGAVVKPYIPHRVDEGYGLNSQALTKLAQAGAKLIITVDCGIRSVYEVEDGKVAGLDIIVTDHHSIGPEIPNALAVINPKQEDCKYPEDMLAGVGVAYKLADALLRAATQERQQPDLKVEDLLDLVAIGTVADLAPLNRTENRALVRKGLAVLSKAERPGIGALLEVAGVKPGSVSAMNIGFSLGPRINAAGRLESAMLAYNLLTTEDYGQATEFAAKLQSLNTERQDLTRAAQEQVRKDLEARKDDTSLLIFASGSFKPGIVGLVAGRLAEEFYRPAIIMEEGETESRASCRSIEQFDITDALDQCADLLVRHGGHAQAAGFTVVNENISALRARLNKLADDRLGGQDLRPILKIDAEADVHQLSESLVSDMMQLEPTGFMNSSPVLMSRNLRVLEARGVGKEGQHLKLKLARAGQPPLDAIGFNLGSWLGRMPERIDVAYELEMNEWNGYRNLQLNLQDIRQASDGA